MTRLRAFGFAMGGAVLLIVAGAAAYFTFFFDANAYKPRLLEAGEAYTGRALSIDGNLSIALLPTPRLRIERLALADAPGFGDAPFAQAAVIEVTAKLWPLLRRRVEVESVAVDEAQVNLKRTRAGKANWTDLFNSKGSANGSDGQSDPATAKLPAVHIKHSEIRLDDARAKRHLVFSDVSVDMDHLGGQDWISVDAKAAVADDEKGLRGTVQLAGKATADRTTDRYGIHDVRLGFQNQNSSSGFGKFDAELTGEGTLDLKAGSMTAAFSVTALEVALKADLSAQAAPANEVESRVRGTLTLEEFNPRALLERLGKQVPAMRDRTALGRAQLALDLSGDKEHLVVRPTGHLDESALSGEITIQHVLEHPVVRFKLYIDKLDVDRYRPPLPKGGPSPYASDPLAALRPDELRALGLDMRGEIKVGTLILNREQTRNYIARFEWGT